MRDGYFIYVMASRTKRIYIGVTNSLERRVWEHKSGSLGGFTSRYQMKSLVYFEDFATVDDAIAREKQLKKWSRGKKLDLIIRMNPGWLDLSVSMFDWVDDQGNIIVVS